MVLAPDRPARVEAARHEWSQSSSPPEQGWRWPAAIAAAAILAFAARAVTGPHPVDDAYITFRYARNLADGLGLVYNPGEWVLGTTTPLWAVLLAGFYRLGAVDLPWTAALLSALFDAITAGLLVLAARRLGWSPLAAWLAGAAWALNPLSVAYASGGMETSLFVLVVIGALSLAAAGKAQRAALLAACGVAVRPEAALVLGVVVTWSLWRTIASQSRGPNLIGWSARCLWQSGAPFAALPLLA